MSKSNLHHFYFLNVLDYIVNAISNCMSVWRKMITRFQILLGIYILIFYLDLNVIKRNTQLWGVKLFSRGGYGNVVSITNWTKQRKRNGSGSIYHCIECVHRSDNLNLQLSLLINPISYYSVFFLKLIRLIIIWRHWQLHPS